MAPRAASRARNGAKASARPGTSSRESSTATGSRRPRRMGESPSRYGPIGSVLTRRRDLGTRVCTRSAHLALLEELGGATPRFGEQGQAKGVEGPDSGTEGGAALLHLLPGLLVVGDGQDGLGSTPRSTTRWRSRSVRTRVLPEPAGAITRAGPAPWATAASWSGASWAAAAAGGGATVSRPRVTVSMWTTADRRSGGRGARAGRRRSRPGGRRAGRRRRRRPG